MPNVLSRRHQASHPLLRPISSAIALALIAGLSLAMPVHAADTDPATTDASTDASTSKANANALKAPKELEEVEVRGTAAQSAITQAPTQADLNITQPQSIIGLDWISNHVAPTADYATIAAISPGVTNVSTAGPGLGESKQMTLRGFNDNQYNVTYDGIPFGDTNDFSHHTSSYFPAKMLGQIVVDRGPGSASTIGEATFGGTVGLSSKDPTDSFSFIPTQSFGSYDTSLTHLEVNSGKLDDLGGGKFIASAQYISTDTAKTDGDMSRKTGYIKYVQPIGDSTEITFLSNYNYIRFNNPNLSSLTLQQITQLGRNFGLNNDPTSVNCACYNYQTKQTDLEYIGVHSLLSETWSLDNKVYTYAYDNTSHESPYVGTKASPTNMGGYIKINNYRAWGDVLQLVHADDHGQFRTGGWYEYTDNNRSSIAIDYGRDGAVDVKPGASTFGTFNSKGVYSGPYKYIMTDQLHTGQLYAEYEWYAYDGLSITPGVKYFDVSRDIEAPINQTTKTPLFYKQSWDKTLGYLTANYTFNQEWSVYAQAAQGFLTPNLNQFYVPNPTANNTHPTQTMNYQFGTVYKTERFNADADVYFINYKNYQFSTTVPGTTDPVYYLAKGAYIKGIEGEATYYVGAGASVFANGSLQDAYFKGSSLDMPNVPNRTAALGVMYENQGFFASLYDKYTGSQKAYNSSFSPDVASSVSSTISTGGYWQAAMSIGYGQNLSGSVIKSYKVRLQVDNLFDAHNLVINSVSSNVGSYYVLPGRSWFASVSLAL
ncbi:TonB-dependent receptor [Dyella sp.]|uniref:TonB-dependent receptor n=1 Tax=Dyella sp. TaxID=1869338 RepID=UPI00284AC276|nr:TonB-dependent receptor [Dyella sp.]MDR3447566.1 TonB-dependent receptor [Dyella sp.]